MVNINNAKLVVPKRDVRVLGETVGRQETIAAEIEAQSHADIQFLLQAITVEETDRQIRQGNEPTRLIVDGRDSKPLDYAYRRTEVQFGELLDRKVMKLIERELAASIRRHTVRRTGGLLDISKNWEWRYYETPGARGEPLSSVAALNPGARLVLRPRSPLNYAGWVNFRVANRGRRPRVFRPSREYDRRNQRGARRGGGGVGFMADAIAKLKRSRVFRNYTIFVSFSKRYRVPGSTYPHGSPCIVLLLKRKRRAYKRIKR